MTGMEFGVAVCDDCGEQRWAGTGPCGNCARLAPDDATVGERECGPDCDDWPHPGHLGAADTTPPATPPADDANRSPVSGGLDEGERSAIVKALYDFPHAGAKWLTFRNGAWAAVESILAARDAARVERLAAVEGERDDWKATAWGNADLVAGLVARAEAAEAERDTARREAGERIAQAWDEGAEAGFDSHAPDDLTDVQARNPHRADALTSDDGSGA